jgi:hypothetical protein
MKMGGEKPNKKQDKTSQNKPKRDKQKKDLKSGE